MRRGTRRLLLVAGVAAGGVAGCVYFNTLYNAERDYARGEHALREGRPRDAGVAFDSVIAKTGRVLAEHPDSKYADDAALLKARSEVHRQRWESALTSAGIAARSASDARKQAVARGLMGLAAYRLGDPDAAETHLGAALEADLPAADRATFHFVRGRARLQLGRQDEAGADLREAVRQVEEGRLDRLELAAALAEVGEYEEAVRLMAGILGAPEVVDLTEAQRRLADTLVARAPGRMEEELGRLLVAGRRPVQRALLHLHRGRAGEELEKPQAALEDYRSAWEEASTTRAAGEAAYRFARLALSRARGADEVAATLGPLETAGGVAPLPLRDSVARLAEAVRTFGGLMEAWEGRGTPAAEALLRAAEVAHNALRAPDLARGLYLRYVEAAPGSPWATKAILGALALEGHDGEGVAGAVDLGAETDAQLRRRLRESRSSDPYVLARTGVPSPAAESAYVRSERALRDRLAGIRGLFEAIPPVASDDTAAAPADTTAPADTAAADTAEVAF